jgi:hypothetical protein
MCKAIASQEWDGAKRRVFVTVTFSESAKHDGRKELDRFRKRWVRRWGPIHAVWWREFQRRGAVHYHFLVEVTPAQHVLLSRWVSDNWHQVGGGTQTHVQEWTGRVAKLYSYAMKEAFARGKEYQHELPVATGAESAVELVDEATGEIRMVAAGLGRWWGVWGCKAPWRWRRLTCAEYCDLRRLARRWGVPLGSLRGRGLVSWWAVAPPALVAASAGR